jgi:biopolymer transport protein TolQ
MLLAVAPFFSAYTQSDFFGKLVFLGLFFLSFISWVVLVHKVFLMRKLKRMSHQFEYLLSQHSGHLLGFNAEGTLSMPSHPYFEVFRIMKQKTIELLNKNREYAQNKDEVTLSQFDIEWIETHLDTTLSSQIKEMEKNLFILSTVVTLAPFLGLLGTVWGISITFANLHGSAMAMGNSAVLSGLAMALGTTVVGLVVAIPAVVAYNYLKNSIRDYAKDMEIFSHRLLSTVEIQYRKVDLQ